MLKNSDAIVLDYHFSTLGSFYEFCIKNKSAGAVHTAWDDMPDTKAWKLDSQARFIPRYFFMFQTIKPNISPNTNMKSKITFYDRKMAIPVETGIDARYYGELMYIIFDKPYCWLHFTGNTKYRVETTLQYMMNNLPKAAFIKCRRSAILNLCYFKSFRKLPQTIVMDDGATFKLSKQNVLDFKVMMSRLSRISPPCPVCYTCTNEECASRIVFCQRKNKKPKEE